MASMQQDPTSRHGQALEESSDQHPSLVRRPQHIRVRHPALASQGALFESLLDREHMGHCLIADSSVWVPGGLPLQGSP